jgi:transposase
MHPASGRTVFHLASGVAIPLFEAELAAFSQAVGAGPHKQIVLVLDRAGWHASPALRVPEHVHLLFLSAYSPELQPAEHLWPLTNTALVNRHFASLDELGEAQAMRCVALERQRDCMRSTMLFSWWPRLITQRQGPRKTSYQGTAFADELVRKFSTAGAQLGENGVEERAEGVAPRASRRRVGQQQGLEERPLGICQIARVARGRGVHTSAYRLSPPARF